MEIFEMNLWLILGLGMISPVLFAIVALAYRMAHYPRWATISRCVGAICLLFGIGYSVVFFFALWVLSQVAWAYITGLFA